VLPLGMGLAFVGYGVGTWGYVLVKGYNISLREWFSPLHPFTGALSKAGMIPAGQLFPGRPSSAGGTSAPNPVQKQQQQNLRHEPNPHGYVQ
jgi:hypothetical protein